MGHAGDCGHQERPVRLEWFQILVLCGKYLVEVGRDKLRNLSEIKSRTRAPVMQEPGTAARTAKPAVPIPPDIRELGMRGDAGFGLKHS
jgi:hypothetical protein